MAIVDNYRVLVDQRPVGGELVVSDFFEIPSPAAPGIVRYRMTEIPLDVITAPSVTDAIYVRQVNAITHVPTGFVFSAVYAPTTPGVGQYQITPALTSGETFGGGHISFNGLDGGITVEIIYTGRGSFVYAEDVNNIQDEITDARGAFANLGDRFASISTSVSRADFVTGTPSGTYTGSTTVYDLPFSYTPGSKKLLVYSAGLLMSVGAGLDYMEVGSTTVSFNSARLAGSNVSFINLG